MIPTDRKPRTLAGDMATVAEAGGPIPLMDGSRASSPELPSIGQARIADMVSRIAMIHNSGMGVNLSVRDAAEIILSTVDPNPEREGIKDTPDRVAKAWAQWTSGYALKAEDILKEFADGGENYDEMVVVKDIPIYSKCEHHLADIFGTATIAYIPRGRVVGLSKLSRLADMHARRLQVQERLTNDIAADLWRCLDPVGVGVLVRARHMCMESRGICQQGHHTITVALRGAMKDQRETRAEFMALA